MRIVMIGQKGFPTLYGGIERHVEELSKNLTQSGHEILLYARSWYTPKISEAVPGIKIIVTPTIHTKHLDAIVHTFTSTIHALFQKPDVIHYHGVGPSLLSWIPRIFLPRTIVVATFHCIDRYHQKWGPMARWFLKLGEKSACYFPHQTISVSKTIQNYCLNEYHEMTVFVPNGVTLQPAPSTASLAAWNVEPNKYVLMVTRLVKHKGAHYLIKAWGAARRLSPLLMHQYKLVIVGGSAFTDDYVAELRNMAKGDASIIFTGWQSGAKLDALYANTRLLVHPSENEGLPLTILQAMAAGRAVLASDIPEHQEVISDSRFWFHNTNVESLTHKLITLLEQPALLDKAGEANRQTALKDYQWCDITKKVAALYTAPLAGRTLAPKLKTAGV